MVQEFEQGYPENIPVNQGQLTHGPCGSIALDYRIEEGALGVYALKHHLGEGPGSSRQEFLLQKPIKEKLAVDGPHAVLRAIRVHPALPMSAAE